MRCKTLFRVQSMHTMNPMFTMCKDMHMEKFKRVMRHIKLTTMNTMLFSMHLEVVCKENSSLQEKTNYFFDAVCEAEEKSGVPFKKRGKATSNKIPKPRLKLFKQELNSSETRCN
jgi:hypothetical protein